MNDVAMNAVEYGIVGVVIATLLGLFVWFVRRMVNALLEHLDSFKKFMSEVVTALKELTTSIQQHDRDMAERLRNK